MKKQFSMIFKNFTESSHGNFAETQNFAPKIWNLMLLRSRKIPAKFEPNRKYAWGQLIQICPILIFNDNYTA